MSLIALCWLLVKLLILGLIWYGLKWVCGFLGVAIPDMVWKILAVILVIIGIVYVLAFLGVG